MFAADDDIDGSANPAFRNITISGYQDPVGTASALEVINNGVAVSGDLSGYGGSQQDYGMPPSRRTGPRFAVRQCLKALDLPVTITENTVLSFDLSIEDAGEIVGIGFDTDNNLSPEFLFQLAGTQTWGLQGAAGQYSVGDGYVHYEIAVGQYFSGDFTRLVFAADDRHRWQRQSRISEH